VSEEQRAQSGELDVEVGADFEVSKVDRSDQRLGRYHLVYEIGRGGMASVYLARARGPAGFQKWFAIKRIHPHLAKDRSFVDMFLDEARIAGSIEHPNVAHVFDLGETDGKYYLAMEYLHGEHLLDVARRAILRNGMFDARMAAHVIARAADGLHHAHEARDGSGSPIELVHRDISPQNIFVTYDGNVKLTDFGVAKAKNRMTHTETGLMKGKIAYASPEQVMGTALDRRTDIFALGVVLWEITTGRRLFKARTDAETLMRISSGYRKRPTDFIGDYPPDLEAIVDRALAHEPEARYPTAADFANDLDRFVGSPGIRTRDCGVFMTSLFGDRMQNKDAVLNRPAAEVPIEVEAVSSEARPLGEPSQSELRRREATATPTPAVVKSRAPLWVGLALVALVLAGLAIAAVVFLSPKNTVLRVESSPRQAEVFLDGQPQGSTPALIEQVSAGTHELELRLDGYTTHRESIAAEGGRIELSRVLTREESAEAPAMVEPVGAMVEPVAIRDEPVAMEEAGEVDMAGEARADDEPTTDASRMDDGDRDVRGTASLNLTTVPGGAMVYVNGRLVGETPFSGRSIPAGRVSLRIVHPERPPKSIRLRIAPGEVVSRRVVL
jgi:serine/threonine protein kinase